VGERAGIGRPVGYLFERKKTPRTENRYKVRSGGRKEKWRREGRTRLVVRGTARKKKLSHGSKNLKHIQLITLVRILVVAATLEL